MVYSRLCGKLFVITFVVYVSSWPCADFRLRGSAFQAARRNLARAPADAAMAAILAAALGGSPTLQWPEMVPASYGFLTGNASWNLHPATDTSTPGISDHLGQDLTALRRLDAANSTRRISAAAAHFNLSDSHQANV
eukprot:7155635-Prymnesium_polylepis.2